MRGSIISEKKKNSLSLFFYPPFLRRDSRVGAPGLLHVDQRRQVEPDRLGGRPRGLDDGGAGHGLPREDPEPGAVDVQERLRPLAARAAGAVGGGRRGSARDHGPRVRGRGVPRGRDDPVGPADPGDGGLELVEPLEERRQHAQLGRRGRRVLGVGLGVRHDAGLASERVPCRGRVGVGDGADLLARDAALVCGVVDDRALLKVGGVPGLVDGPDAVELVHGLVDERDLFRRERVRERAQVKEEGRREGGKFRGRGRDERFFRSKKSLASPPRLSLSLSLSYPSYLLLDVPGSGDVGSQVEVGQRVEADGRARLDLGADDGNLLDQPTDRRGLRRGDGDGGGEGRGQGREGEGGEVRADFVFVFVLEGGNERWSRVEFFFSLGLRNKKTTVE